MLFRSLFKALPMKTGWKHRISPCLASLNEVHGPLVFVPSVALTVKAVSQVPAPIAPKLFLAPICERSTDKIAVMDSDPCDHTTR